MAMLGGGDMAQAKSGTFTGDGTANVALNIGFEPDAIIIDSGLNTAIAGTQGILGIYLVKGIFTMNFYHNSSTDNTERQYAKKITSTEDAWGGSSGAYRSYATYSNGTLTITNKTPSNDNVKLINGQAYSWTAYKA